MAKIKNIKEAIYVRCKYPTDFPFYTTIRDNVIFYVERNRYEKLYQNDNGKGYSPCGKHFCDTVEDYIEDCEAEECVEFVNLKDDIG